MAALLLRRGRTQTRPAFQRFEAVAVLLLERFRGGFAFSAGPGPGLSRESPFSRIRNRDGVNSHRPRARRSTLGADAERNPRRFSRRPRRASSPWCKFGRLRLGAVLRVLAIRPRRDPASRQGGPGLYKLDILPGLAFLFAGW